jgi:site-specific recombinase XerD
MKSATLAYLLHAFFHGWLTQQRNTSPHTIKSYRDTWRIFLVFVADCKHRSVADLAMEDLTSKEVLAFLQHVERERKITIGTRNCRLAAIHSSSIRENCLRRTARRDLGSSSSSIVSMCASAANQRTGNHASIVNTKITLPGPLT